MTDKAFRGWQHFLGAGAWITSIVILMLVSSACMELSAGPSIQAFTADPETVNPGETVRLSWQVDGLGNGRLELMAIEEGGGEIHLGDVTGQSTLAVITERTTTYRLIAATPGGESAREVKVSVTGGGGGGQEPPADEAILVLIAGQSNASGYGLEDGGRFPTDATEQPVDGVMMLDPNKRWVRAAEPTHHDAKHSFGLRLGKELKNATSRDVYLVPAAIGGSQLRDWQPGEKYYEDAVSRAEFASASVGVPVSAVVWFQGESESKSSGSRRSFVEDTDNVLEAMHRNLPGNPEVIFVQLSKRLFHGTVEGDNVEGHNLAYQEIREKQRLMEAGAKVLTVGSSSPGESSVDRPYYTMVVSHDLGMSDVKHLSAASQRTLGRRIANAFFTSVWSGSKQGVFGLGPRLERVVLVDGGSSVLVDTTREINDSSDYDGYFTVFVDGSVRSYQRISRDGSDPTRIRIEFSSPLEGDVEVRYMPPDDAPLYQDSSEAVHSVVGGLKLPLPAFNGPVEPLPQDYFPGLRRSEG